MSRDAWHDRDFARDWDESGNLLTNPDRLRQLTLLADLIAAESPRHLLDLGIGSAQVEAVIARRHPGFFQRCRVTGIDASSAMLTLARERCAAEDLASVELQHGDFAALETVELGRRPDAAICVQALHEVPHETKRLVFARLREWLPPGAPLYILDRFGYPGRPWLNEWRSIWKWMSSGVSADVLEFDDYHRRYRAKSDYLASVEDYRAWLEAAGFETICPYTCFNRALIAARVLRC